MRNISIGILGNSLSLGLDASDPQFMLFWRIVEGIRKRGGVNVYPHWTPSNYGGRLGCAFRYWTDYLSQVNPDVVIFQNSENEYATTEPASVTGSISENATEIIFNTAPVANQIYRIHGYLEPNGEFEYVQPLGVSTNTGTQVRRGVLGTTPRRWAAGSEVANDAGSSNWTGDVWIQRYEDILRYIAGSSPVHSPMILVGGKWFATPGSTNAEAKIEALVNQMQLEGYRIEFCPYVLNDTEKFGTIGGAPYRIYNYIDAADLQYSFQGPAATTTTPFRAQSGSGTTGTGCTVTLTVSGGSGAITGASIVAGGSGYPTSATFDISVYHAAGYGGILNVTTDGAGVITTINSVAAGGVSYTSAVGAGELTNLTVRLKITAGRAEAFDVGEKILMAQSTAPTTSNSQIVTVLAIDAEAQIVTVNRTNGSATLQSTTKNSTASTRLAKQCNSATLMHNTWLNGGEATYFGDGLVRFGVDDHPNNAGHAELANCFLAGYDRLMARF